MSKLLTPGQKAALNLIDARLDALPRKMADRTESDYAEENRLMVIADAIERCSFNGEYDANLRGESWYDRCYKFPPDGPDFNP